MKHCNVFITSVIAHCLILLSFSLGFCEESTAEHYVPHEVLVKFHEGIDE